LGSFRPDSYGATDAAICLVGVAGVDLIMYLPR
jgi:hypothetical protein